MIKNDQHITELISFYLDDELDQELIPDFEAHLKVCPECSDLLEKHRAIHGTIKESGQEKQAHISGRELDLYIRKEIPDDSRILKIEEHLAGCVPCKKIYESMLVLDKVRPDDVYDEILNESSKISERNLPPKSARPAVRIVLNRKMVLAASIAALLILLPVWILPRNKYYADLAVIDPPAFVAGETRGSSEDIRQETFLEGMKQYHLKAYDRSSDLLERLAVKTPDNPQYQYYCGISLLLEGKYRRGLKYLRKESILHSGYAEDAMWYAAMAYLKLGKAVKATELLDQLTSGKNTYANRASEILEQIQSK